MKEGIIMPPRKPLKPIKILIIGNGFDLANNLPTTYRDFLEFCEKVSYIFEDTSLKTVEEYYNKYLQEWEFNNDVKLNLMNFFIVKSNTGETTQRIYSFRFWQDSKKRSLFLEKMQELYDCINDNVWYRHFNEKIKGNSKIGKNWIDFESEIAEVLLTKDEKQSTYFNMQRELRALDDEMSSILLKHLNRLTRALELYLDVILNAITPKKIEDLNDEVFNYILSFNYTNTFFKHYKMNISYEYTERCCIHGEVSDTSSIETCNLVLGIDDKEEIDDEQFLPFKKFYQRIIKQTNNNYSNWLDEIKTSPEYKYELHIFGHSLDVTDKDILKDFMLNDNVVTKIYYYRRYENDKADFSSKIRNLIKIIGKEELIKRTSNGTIKFVAQKLAEKTE